ncbi:MAG: beta-glucosidase family protein [Rhizomicrobium sp.]
MHSRNTVRTLLLAAAMWIAGFLPATGLAQTPAGSSGPAPAWMNPALPPDARGDLLQAQLTQDDELRLVMGYWGAAGIPFSKPVPKDLQPLLRGTAGFVPGIPRLGIPALVESDAGEGIANGGGMRPGDEATALPSGMLVASTWDPSIAKEAGAVIGAEAHDRGFNVVLDGAMNLARDPRGGRIFEYAGEDPLLAGRMAGAEVAGVQSAGVVSTVKHFAFNDQETGRFQFSAEIGEGPARESDLLAFEIAIETGDPGAVMCAYNRYDGVYSCENDFLLNQVLKRDWSYPGWVLSDWGAVHSTVASANAGLDQQSASGFDHEEYFGAALKDALADGHVDPNRLHDMVHRILRSMFAKGLMDWSAAARAQQTAAHLAIAQKEAEEGIVLLKNAVNLLPLPSKLESIAVIGGNADRGVLSGGGSSQVIPIGFAQSLKRPGEPDIPFINGAPVFDPPSPLSAIAAQAPQAIVTFDSGEDIAQAQASARQSDVAIVFATQWMAEGSDVANLSLPGKQDALIAAIAAANPRTIVVLETGGPVLMPWLANVQAVLESWYSGNGGANAIARILFGGISPSGRLPVTFPQTESQLPRPILPGADAHGAPFDIDDFEGSDVGYRWYELKNLTPLFPFGYGLSYSHFVVGGVRVQGGATVTIAADVTNDGTIEAAETLEAYAAPAAADTDDVPRLIGWSRVDLKPAETRHIAIAADPRLLADFDIFRHVWHIEGGNYVVRIAESVADPGTATTVRLDERDLRP